MVAFRLKTGGADLELFDLPWEVPLEDWPEELSVKVPEGTHRHVVRFINVSDTTLALKELPTRLAEREYEMLERLREERLPGVTLIGIATDRVDVAGEPLESVLVTRHLRYSLPYRHLFAEHRGDELRYKMIDALAVLLVRIHTAGFFWGDCSLNNALFRRDAGALRAYVVDTETAEWHETLSPGQRQLDLTIATENALGGLLDLEAEGLLLSDVDPGDVTERLVERYTSLWTEVHESEELESGDLGRIQARLSRLNELGFDTEEYELHAVDGIARFRPTIVEEGHHKRVLHRLTGIEAHENQARRLLSALRGYSAWLSQTEGDQLPEAVAAYRWLTERWQPTMAQVPADLRGRLEDAEVYHQILQHNLHLNEVTGTEVPLEDALASYVDAILASAPDERTVLPIANDVSTSDNELTVADPSE